MVHHEVHLMYISNFLMYIGCSLTVDREVHLCIFDMYNIVITSVKVAVWVTWFNIQEHWYGWVPGGACIWWTSLVCNNDSIWFFILLYMREKMAINNGAVFKIWMSDLRTSSKVKKSYSVQLCAARGPPCKLYVMLASVKCLYVAVGLEQYSAKRCYTVQKK